NVLGVYDAGDPDQALENFETMNGTARELIEGYSALVNEREQLITEMEDQIVAEGETAITIQVIAVVITLVISVVLAFIISNRISRPINLIKDQMRKVGDGKLNLKPLKVESKDEIGQMAAETNHMQHRLQEIITNISQATEEMTSHSEELMQSSSEVQSVSERDSATMQELASGSESQANHAGEIATAIDNFIQKVEVSNENGEKIQQSSTEVVDMAEKGHELMQSSEHQMKSID